MNKEVTHDREADDQNQPHDHDDETSTDTETEEEDSLEILHVDPYNINVSELNERQTLEGLTDHTEDDGLVDSVRRTGTVIQPPLVRHRGEGKDVEYEVIVGQRRVMAAQQVGIDEIPVVVVPWDDPQALAHSITENVDTFREKVRETDRARAVQRLYEMTGGSKAEIADQIGVSPDTLRRWFERANEQWEGTWLDPEPDRSSPTGSVIEPTPNHDSGAEDDLSDEERLLSGEIDHDDLYPAPDTEDAQEATAGADEDVEIDRGPTVRDRLDREPHPEDLGDKQLQSIRPAMREAGFTSVEDINRITKHLAREGLSLHDTEEVSQRIKRGQDPIEAIDEVSAAKSRTQTITKDLVKVSTRVAFEGDIAEALQSAAEDRKTSDEAIVREAISAWLTDEGYIGASE